VQSFPRGGRFVTGRPGGGGSLALPEVGGRRCKGCFVHGDAARHDGRGGRLASRPCACWGLLGSQSRRKRRMVGGVLGQFGARQEGVQGAMGTVVVLWGIFGHVRVRRKNARKIAGAVKTERLLHNAPRNSEMCTLVRGTLGGHRGPAREGVCRTARERVQPPARVGPLCRWRFAGIFPLGGELHDAGPRGLARPDASWG
jgi:hypothetical protein